MTSKFALVIASTQYQDQKFAKLTAPGRDAEEFARVLRDPQLAAFEEVQVLMNEGEGQTRRAIARFFAGRKPADLLLLYFSGHGLRNEQGQLFLAAQDTEIKILEATGIPAEFITRAMNNSRSQRQLLILDCCNSGAFAYGSKSPSGVGESMGTATAFEGNGYGRVVLTATDATQFAWQGEDLIGNTQNSVFTHFLIEGLKGAADRDGDGRITVDELYDYAYEQVVRRTPKQTPGKWSYREQGELVLCDHLKIQTASSDTGGDPSQPKKAGFRLPAWWSMAPRSNLFVRVPLLAVGVILAIWGGLALLRERTLAGSTPPSIPTAQSGSPSSTQGSSPLTSTPASGPLATSQGRDGMTLVYVPAGAFRMGSNGPQKDETPPHSVYLDAFWIDQTEVTNAMYARCVNEGPCNPPHLGSSNTRDRYYGNPEFDRYPVIHVSWQAAQAYCTWADRRLPTEAEWEKAARGTDERLYPWGGNLPPSGKLVNYNNTIGDTSEVGIYPEGASPYGALDMAGNVWEWVADSYSDTYYRSSPTVNPLGPPQGERVYRGGMWGSGTAEIRSTYRKHNLPTDETKGLGFRCARSP